MRRRSWTTQPLSCSRLLWGLALLGVILLPSDYRAGAEFPHAHSLVQLWVDAEDGMVHHHDAGSTAWDEAGSSKERPDIGEHDDSMPTTSGMHLLLNAITILTVAPASQMPA